jgi:hypothetical protein
MKSERLLLRDARSLTIDASSFKMAETLFKHFHMVDTLLHHGVIEMKLFRMLHEVSKGS